MAAAARSRGPIDRPARRGARSPKSSRLAGVAAKQSVSPKGMTAKVTSAGKSAMHRARGSGGAVGVRGDEVLLPDHLHRVGGGVERAGEAERDLAVGHARGRVDAGDEEERGEEHAGDLRGDGRRLGAGRAASRTKRDRVGDDAAVEDACAGRCGASALLEAVDRAAAADDAAERRARLSQRDQHRELRAERRAISRREPASVDAAEDAAATRRGRRGASGGQEHDQPHDGARQVDDGAVRADAVLDHRALAAVGPGGDRRHVQQEQDDDEDLDDREDELDARSCHRLRLARRPRRATAAARRR